MLNTFPILLSFAIFVPFIFRIVIALFLLQIIASLKNKTALTSYFQSKNYPLAKHLAFGLQIIFAVSAVLITLGLYTQITSLVIMYFLFVVQGLNKQISFIKHSNQVLGYVALISFSLLFLGAGAFAFDLPL